MWFLNMRLQRTPTDTPLLHDRENVGFSIGQFLSGLDKSGRLPELDHLPAAAPAGHSLDGDVAHLHPERWADNLSQRSIPVLALPARPLARSASEKPS